MFEPVFQTKVLVVFTKASIQITGTLKTLHASSATDSTQYGKIPRSVGIARNVSYWTGIASDKKQWKRHLDHSCLGCIEVYMYV